MEVKIYVTPENAPCDYVGYDLFGYPFNQKYPPNKEKLGVLLYDYCVMGYDVELNYKDKTLLELAPEIEGIEPV